MAMDDPIHQMPMTNFRIFSAALWLRHHPEIGGMEVFRLTRKRYGLTASEAMEARDLAFDLRNLWPVQGRWP